MDNCTLDCIEIVGNFSHSETCQFVQDSCDQDTVQFIQGYYCLIHQSFVLLVLFSVLLFSLLYLVLNALTEHFLTPCVEDVITKFKISPTLAGVSFLAFANGAPDVLTAVLAGSSSSQSTVLIPFGSIFGASLFSSAFILSAVVLQSPGQRLRVKRQEILTPLSFYIFGITFLILVSVTYGKMNLYIAFVLVLAYLIFIALILKNEKKRREQHIKDLEEERERGSQKQVLAEAQAAPISEIRLNSESEAISSDAQLNPSKQSEQDEGSEENGLFALIGKVEGFLELGFHWLIPPISNEKWQPTRSIASIVVSPFVLALSQGLTDCFSGDWLGVPVMVYLSVPALILLVHVALCLRHGIKPIESAFYTFYAFLVTVAWLTIACGVLINLLELVQLLTTVNSVFLGLTFLAWANCIGDYLSITAFAKKGRGSTAVSGIFSGQLFNFLIGFGASLMVQSADGEFEFGIFSFEGTTFQILSDAIVVLLILSGLVYFSFIFYKVIEAKGVFHHKDAVLFRGYYVAVLLLAVLIAILTDFFKEISCDL